MAEGYSDHGGLTSSGLRPLAVHGLQDQADYHSLLYTRVLLSLPLPLTFFRFVAW